MYSAEVFLEEFRRVGRTAFSMWNRDPGSPSFGSFDRPYWGWKFKDLSDATLQYAIKVVIEYTALEGVDSGLGPMVEGFVSFCRRVQHRDGSFDQSYPYERTPGVIYDILSTLIYVRESHFLDSARARAELDDIIERAAAFALRTDERHGEIANHLIQYASELVHYGRFSGDPRAMRRADEYLARFLALFHAPEGWFMEYDGPDAGYQTRALRYLVKVATCLDSQELWEVAAKAARFLEQIMMPDGSIHPMLGVRSTALLYPSAFEVLASRDAAFHDLALRVRQGWNRARVPLPSTLDFNTAIRLADDAFEAYHAGHNGPVVLPNRVPTQPSQPAHFEAAGLSVFRSPRRVVFVATRLGGVVVIFVRGPDGIWRLRWEDAGHLLVGDDRRVAWLTRRPGSGRVLHADAGRLRIQAAFCRSLHDELSPFRLVALRLLNLTVLRNQWLGDMFRKLVVWRLMRDRRTSGLRLIREVRVDADAVRMTDRFEADPHWRRPPGSRMFRCRRVTGTHMASARYFQPQELEPMDQPWMAAQSWTLDEEIVMEVSTRAGE
jgi:hypothetical protein